MQRVKVLSTLFITLLCCQAIAKNTANRQPDPTTLFQQLLMQIIKNPEAAKDKALQTTFSDNFQRACLDGGREASKKTKQDFSKKENSKSMQMVEKQCQCVAFHPELITAFGRLGHHLGQSKDGKAAYASFETVLSKTDKECMTKNLSSPITTKPQTKTKAP